MKRIDLEFVKETLREAVPDLVEADSDETYKTALIIMSALRCGPDVALLADFTGLPRTFITPIHQRMLDAELWTDTDVRSDHWAPAPGLFDSTAFWLDVLIAEGLVVRQWDEEQGDYLYRHVDYAPEKESIRAQ